MIFNSNSQQEVIINGNNIPYSISTPEGLVSIVIIKYSTPRRRPPRCSYLLL